MKVKDLKEKLNDFDENKEVFILTRDDNPVGGGLDIEDIYEINGSRDLVNNAVYIIES